MTGETLGHYEIGERLGRGGMGEVYLATDLRLRRTVALKVLSPESAGDPDRRARFEREARAVAGLNHPNIVTVHSIEEADTADGTIHFITMERVEGATLAEWIAEDGLDVGRLLEIAVPLADAVGAAHRAGVTHRDLKPHNVMITSDGRVKVLDFGLAKLAATATDPATASQLTTEIETREGTIVGTVPYMSPEQVQGRPVGPPGDVFSLGVMIYEMACGRRPFDGDTPIGLLSSILKDEPEPLANVPADLDGIVRKCLAKDPDDRFADGGALLRALSEVDVAQAPVLGDVPSAPPPPSPIGSPSGDGRIERLGSLAATSDDAAQRVLDVMREDERRKLRTLVDSYRLGGFITIVAGVGLAIFLATLRADEVPGLPLIGLIPVLVGGCLVIYARMLARRPD